MSNSKTKDKHRKVILRTVACDLPIPLFSELKRIARYNGMSANELAGAALCQFVDNCIKENVTKLTMVD